jgi:hypothetical protein
VEKVALGNTGINNVEVLAFATVAATPMVLLAVPVTLIETDATA